MTNKFLTYEEAKKKADYVDWCQEDVFEYAKDGQTFSVNLNENEDDKYC